MADEYDPIEKQLERAGAGKKKKGYEQEPSYQMIGDSKIPVSKAMGSVWASRKDQGLAHRGPACEAWDEAIRYYDHDQLSYRKSTDNASGNRTTMRLNGQWTETENVVFANCSIMVPMLYAKNPQITVTSDVDANLPLGKCLERLMNTLMAKKAAPGLNAKTKFRRSILVTLLTNAGFIKIGFNLKEDSTETHMAELQKMSQELENAKGKKEILAVEGKIKALEEKITMLSPSGPWMKGMLPERIVVDPTSVEPDGSDANWMMEYDYLPTSYINAVYGYRHGDQTCSVYEPTHVLEAKGAGSVSEVEEQVNTFTLLPDEDAQASTYGYSNKAAFEQAKHTKVWYVWDKTTRRVLMFADNYWKWPLWVWDDPLKLPRFFPYFRLWFHESPNAHAPKGEVTYYLDQQDAINDINSEIARGRSWSKRNILYNKNAIDQNDVETILKGDDGTARGIDLPEGTKLQDHIFSFVPPGFDRPEFYSTDSKFVAINRITGINEAQRGAQFKTNTTNKAVETYNRNTDIRVDERVDLIEDFIGDICWNLALLCMMHFDAEDVAPFVGAELAQNWQKINSPSEFEARFSVRVEGGSSAKPNSREKKQQALELGQILGQFASAAPAVVVVILKMFQSAFDEFTMEDQDWAMINETMQAALQKAGGGPGEQGQEQQQQGGPVTDEAMIQQIKQRIAALPPTAQAKIEEMVNAGMPPSEALEKVEADIQPQ